MALKERQHHKQYKIVIVLAVVVVVLFAGLVYGNWHTQKANSIIGGENNTDALSRTIGTQEINANPSAQPASGDSSTSTSTKTTAPTTAEDYYEQGVTKFTQKDYTKAITSIDKAIALDSHQPNYYNKKSQAQYNLGQKDKAIATVQEGLNKNPDSDLLKSRLDILQKDSFNPSFD